MTGEPRLEVGARGRSWLFLGLFLTTVATLCVEVLDTRLLSVMAWYHLSFFAVSIAMFGMAAGALRVYLGGSAFEGRAAEIALGRQALLLAVLLPVCHVQNLVIRIPSGTSAVTIAALFTTTLALAVPFYVSGIVVTIVLTRMRAPIGRSYAVDLAGAALGSVLVVPLFAWSNLTTAVLACAALAAFGAAAFARHARASTIPGVTLALSLCALSWWNASASAPLTVFYVKDRFVGAEGILSERWNVHSRVVLPRQAMTAPFYWGAGSGIEGYRVEGQPLAIDGDALTVMSAWNGDPDTLEWVRHDVTSLPYHVRPGGDACVIGVGGGRDVLTAVWAQSQSIVGLEINGILVDLLRGERRTYAGIADRPEVRLVHDEARSWLTRTEKRFDVLQMSLIDTWASTAAGGFTLTENGLYTREAWRVFLATLKPAGVLSVSRWYDPEKVTETTRLVALGAVALLDAGVERPADHLVLAAVRNCATLLVSRAPFTSADLEQIRATCARFGFTLVIEPGAEPALPIQSRVVRARTADELELAVADPAYDYTPPTDERPFFFNLLKARVAFSDVARNAGGGVLRGNMQATATLLILGLISLALVVGVVLVPLLAHGLPRLDAPSFALATAWFATIGLGFMLVQVAFLQRFSVYLGHPTYAVVTVLFGMILATGAGSLASDRARVEGSPRTLVRLALLTAGALFVVSFALQPIVEGTIGLGLAARSAIALLVVAPVAFLLGHFFPIGLRVLRASSEDALPWMWGVNGAAGVLGAVLAVAISMWAGIGVNLIVALVLYGSLALVGPALMRRGVSRD